MKEPLKDIKILEFSHILAAPACAYFLSLLGAEVIKVEPIGNGDSIRNYGGSCKKSIRDKMSTSYLTQGSNKKSLAIDLSTDEGKIIFNDLLSKSDVLIENHLPSTLRSLNIDLIDIKNSNPKIIICSLSGYGKKGNMEDLPAYDVNIQAISGIIALTGSNEDGPTRTGAPIMDYATALNSCFAIMTALYRRSKDGTGSIIDVSMLETAYTLMSSIIVDYLFTGNHPKKKGNSAGSGNPTAGNYQCKTGVLSLGVNKEKHFKLLLKMLGKGEWLKNSEYCSIEACKKNEEKFKRKLASIFKLKSAVEWEEIGKKYGIPVSRVLSITESIKIKQNNERNFFHEFKSKKLKLLTLPFRLNQENNHAPKSPPPKLGEHTSEILDNLGYSCDDIKNLKTKRIVQ